MNERAAQELDRRIDDAIEQLVLDAYSADLPDDPDVQAAVDRLGELIAEVRTLASRG
jgi:hypothetical protein